MTDVPDKGSFRGLFPGGKVVREDGSAEDAEVTREVYVTGVPNPLPRVGRLTVVETCVYYAPGDDKPVTTDARFSRAVTTDEQPYVRRCALGEDWVPLDTGWLAGQVSAVVVENHRPARQAIPSPQERAAEDGAVVEVGVTTPTGNGEFYVFAALTVPVGEACRFNFVATQFVRLRCRAGKAKVTITAFPS